MGLSRRGLHRESPIWPGFVDAMTSLLMVLMFVLTVFVLIQSVLRETITEQSGELDSLSAQVADLADALGLERLRATGLETQVGQLDSDLAAAAAEGATQSALIATLTGQLSARQGELAEATARISSFEAQVASLLAERDAARGQAGALTAEVTALEAAQTRIVSEQEALQLALARARDEIDAGTEAARLAAAQADAMDLLIADLKSQVSAKEASLADTLSRLQAATAEGATLEAQLAALQDDLATAQAGALSADQLRTQLADLEAKLTDEERARLAEVAAAATLRARLSGAEAALTETERARLADLAATEALRARLQSADAEVTAMTLALEEQRKRAEETLTLLAAAEAAQSETAREVTEAERRAGLLQAAETALATEKTRSAESTRRVALLNEQIAQLTAQLGALQGLLDASAERDAAAQVQLEALGGKLNSALAQVASEQRRRADLEEAERIRLQAEAQQLERFRSEFFGQLREVLAGREGVRIVGDRFVFSSEVLFQPGAADLAPEGQAQIAGVAATLSEVAEQIPPGIDWIIRVDGHTDNVPLSGAGAFADNWELSQARALSVVRYMQDELGFPPNRMAATGFAEFQPVAEGDSPEARAQNRRIELKLTER